MTSTSATDSEAVPLWEYVPIADYSLPAAPVADTARRGLVFFRHLFRRNEAESEPLLQAEEGLRKLPQWRLDRIAPKPDWYDAAEALDAQLQDWLQQDRPDRPVIVLVGPPHSGHSGILTAWAEQHTGPLLRPPTAEQILSGDDGWISDQNSTLGSNASNGKPWVFPSLEKAYLRHAAGLDLVRRFLDRAYSGDLGRGIIGCDSWAWAFLRQVWYGPRPVTLALQAFDPERLTTYLQETANRANDRALRFCQSDTGKDVLPPSGSNGDTAELSSFLKLLAAHNRGILGGILAVWRASLRTEPDDALQETAQGATEETVQEGGQRSHQTVWVTPWDQINLPQLPAHAGRDEAFVLHALLLHNGLPREYVQQLLTLSSSQTTETLYRLQDAGLVARHNDVWQISALGYPAVRRFIQTNGYLVDHF